MVQVLIIASSSFGEGDPPYNYVDFLVQLLQTASTVKAAGCSPPLQGLQHAVVGFGQSVYPSFQNNPRFTDKLLGELGSRRFVRRVELDEGEEETIEAGAADGDGGEFFGSGPGAADRDIKGRRVGLDRFAAKVLDALREASKTADLPPVCSWDEPGNGKLIEKTEDELINGRPQVVEDSAGAGGLTTAAVVVALLAAAAGSYYYSSIA